MRESLPASLTDRSTYRSFSLRSHLLAGIGPRWRRLRPGECAGEFRGSMGMASRAGDGSRNSGSMTDQRADWCDFAVRATEIPMVGLGHRDRIRKPSAAQRWLSIEADRALVSPIVTACQPRRSSGQVVQIAVFRAKCERCDAAWTLGACMGRVRRGDCGGMGPERTMPRSARGRAGHLCGQSSVCAWMARLRDAFPRRP